MTDAEREAKRRAAVQAAALVESGMIVGLGTGSTAALAVDELGRRLAAGELERVVGVPTSESTRRRAEALGIALATLDDRPVLDVTIDGADEASPSGDLIKGLGGALLREKMVAAASRLLVIAVDARKLVARLGTRAPVPVEVVRFGAGSHAAALRALGAEPVLRTVADGTPFVTDEGHYIIDCRFRDGIPDPAGLDLALHRRAGVVETGLFLGMRPRVIVGRAEA